MTAVTRNNLVRLGAWSIKGPFGRDSMAKRKGFVALIAIVVWILVIAIAVYLPPEAKYNPLLDLLEFLMFFIPAGGVLYLISLVVRARFDPELKAKTERSLSRVFFPIGLILFAFFVCGGIYGFWQSYATNRTTTIRQVFLRDANSNGPRVYMDDGTVWSLEDTSEKVLMISGDNIVGAQKYAAAILAACNE